MKKILSMILILVLSFTVSYAEEPEEIDCWVMCQPDSWVYARLNPNKNSMEIGRLECGDHIYTDGKEKNGFLHVYVLFEYGEGWVHKGYIVYDEPQKPVFQETTIQSNGRVKARKTIGGKRRCWLKDEQKIKVYMYSEEWAVTNKGFVQTQFIDLGK